MSAIKLLNSPNKWQARSNGRSLRARLTLIYRNVTSWLWVSLLIFMMPRGRIVGRVVRLILAYALYSKKHDSAMHGERLEAVVSRVTARQRFKRRCVQRRLWDGLRHGTRR